MSNSHKEDNLCKEAIYLINELISRGYFSQEFDIIYIQNELASSGNKKRDAMRGRQLNLKGRKKGVPDYLVMWKDNLGFIEAKADKGIISPKQKEFAERVFSLGHKHAFCFSASEILKVIEAWIGIKKTS